MTWVDRTPAGRAYPCPLELWRVAHLVAPRLRFQKCIQNHPASRRITLSVAGRPEGGFLASSSIHPPQRPKHPWPKIPSPPLPAHVASFAAPSGRRSPPCSSSPWMEGPQTMPRQHPWRRWWMGYPTMTYRAASGGGGVTEEQGWRMVTARTWGMEDGRGRRAVDLVDLINFVESMVGPVCMVRRGEYARARPGLRLSAPDMGWRWGCRSARTYMAGLRSLCGSRFCDWSLT